MGEIFEKYPKCDIFSLTKIFFQGYRYRFRIINAGYLNCPIEMSVDNHTLKVISSDGKDFIPIEGKLDFFMYIDVILSLFRYLNAYRANNFLWEYFIFIKN